MPVSIAPNRNALFLPIFCISIYLLAFVFLISSTVQIKLHALVKLQFITDRKGK